MKLFKFSLIIANFNGEKYLKDCLNSVFKTNYKNFEVILTDDGSTDGSLNLIEKFKKEYKFTLIKNKKNLGLVASRNKAIKSAKGEILVFLDNDTKVDKNWLNGLNEIFNRDEQTGAAQCKIFDFHKKTVIQEIGMKIMPFTGFGVPLGRGKQDNGQFDEPIEIISLGAALAVKKEAAKKIGGFDRKLFHYTDDLDFSWRLWIAGFKVVSAPKSKIYHYTKVHNHDYKLYFHLTKNSIRMVIKNYQIENLIKFLPICLGFNTAGILYVLFTRRSISGILGFLMGIIWTIIFLPDTLKERRKIQSLRKTLDEEIYRKVMIKADIPNIYKLYFNTAKKTKILMKGSV